MINLVYLIVPNNIKTKRNDLIGSRTCFDDRLCDYIVSSISNIIPVMFWWPAFEYIKSHTFNSYSESVTCCLIWTWTPSIRETISKFIPVIPISYALFCHFRGFRSCFTSCVYPRGLNVSATPSTLNLKQIWCHIEQRIIWWMDPKVIISSENTKMGENLELCDSLTDTL